MSPEPGPELKLPAEPGQPPCATIPISITIGSLQDTISLKPAALGSVLIERYCAGGWDAVVSFSRQAFAQLTNSDNFGSSWPLDSTGNRVPPPPNECLAIFVKAFTNAQTNLENQLQATLTDLAQEAWAEGRNRIAQIRTRIAADQARYRDKVLSGGTEGGPEDPAVTSPADATQPSSETGGSGETPNQSTTANTTTSPQSTGGTESASNQSAGTPATPDPTAGPNTANSPAESKPADKTGAPAQPGSSGQDAKNQQSSPQPASSGAADSSMR